MQANRSKLLVILTICFISLALLLWLSGKNQSGAADNAKIMVVQDAKVRFIEAQQVEQYIRQRKVFGQLQARQQANLGFDRSGTIATILAEEGALVENGQALASMDIKRLVSQREELKASLQRAKAEAKLSLINRKRVTDLVEAKLEPRQRLDEAQAKLEADNAIVNEIEARLLTLEVEIEKSTIFAPFSGQIITQNVDAGAVVNAGQVIFQLIDNHALEAKFGLPEKTAFLLNTVEDFAISIDGNKVHAELKSISLNRNSATRTMDAIFSIYPDSKKQVVTGDLVVLSVDIPYAKSGVWLPLSALSSGVRGMWSVLVVDENNLLVSKLVIVEQVADNKVFVSGAIKQGDKVVIEGTHRLSPGQLVSNTQRVNDWESTISMDAY